MDPAVSVGLDATTAITGLLAVGASAIDILCDLNISPQHDTAVLNLFLREVKECRSSIHALCKTLSLLENAQIPFPARAAWISLDDLVATLTDTVLAFSRVYSLCCVLDDEAARSSPEDAAKLFEKRVKALCARVRWHNLSIAMMMTIINCPGEKDAKRSRDELAHRVCRLLTFNVGLATRLRRTSRPGSSAAKPPSPGAENSEISGIAPVCVGPLAAPGSWPASLTGCTLADRKALSRMMLPVALGELRDDYEFYLVDIPQQFGGCDFARDNGVLVGMPHKFTSAQ
ncbi:hypothetical protein FZEAL_6394 [Fusarium zealandicum]|uniref:Fungal N-terminal domain-containing protein n=1 Tax=Fusarium zealandicum TaxID=1053134 RepID=A0A8H4UIZ7_9HYPO|nr:hypothetical protein FZEAL_6394 [Fusarium zealandicum]